MQALLGIDIAKATFHAALLVDESSKDKSFPNNHKGFTQLDHWLRNRQVDRVHACLEATGSYGEALALHLADAGHTVSIVNPARIKGFANSELQRNKTDQIDAGVIDRFCKDMQPKAWTPPALEVRELQALVRRRQSLQATRQRELNRQQVPGLPSTVQRSVDDLVRFLDAEITHLDKLIHEHIDQHPRLRTQTDLLTSIPGIGAATAATLISEIPDVAQFATVKQLVAFAGLSPRQHQSGSSIHRKASLAKIGNPRLRKALFYPAMVAMIHNPPLHATAMRLRSAGKSKMAILGALMRKLLHLAYGILKSQRAFDPAYRSA
jgi:transposase